MQLTLLTTLASLATSTLAAPAALISRQGITNPRLAQFRVFSATGCFDLNQGFYTIDTDQSNVCYNLQQDAANVSPLGYVSIQLQAITANSTASNCKLLLYSDDACEKDRTEAPLNVCEDAPVTQDGDSNPNWNSYYYQCNTSQTTRTTYPIA
ncbi:hypothetical protein BKA67DRAFT_659702 [Truncatella angustata]|uniref:Uncharacterized protein n=1 Tax=Truncatella angustata TaxID=152316 RepID=A0A9P8ZXH2_9PEZI|nr:uncharacterized protein BKA67DRAFT_659702 [Truncatella angustata]KAH6653058.1 hypothetical protein BKA67DRAFT_659702 [Truncatella angustata]KAH8194634.1 hypothetical protein TruAng_011209 [Truncatella angustata]